MQPYTANYDWSVTDGIAQHWKYLDVNVVYGSSL